MWSESKFKDSTNHIKGYEIDRRKMFQSLSVVLLALSTVSRRSTNRDLPGKRKRAIRLSKYGFQHTIASECFYNVHSKVNTTLGNFPKFQSAAKELKWYWSRH
ncbi:hypothetical protein TNCT_554731 [Trichonephila clavata]|uniref:Uncharacterized protein n=1 Tax=Trichonephila clavata TaxID=2740835 RepID=A0A8X6FP37_TRICU|nr:hypothetical protein TNCT_554731 [Trichonephila clavata]